MTMKTLGLLLTILALCLPARAQVTYLNAASSGTTSCTILVPGLGGLQTVIPQAICTTDLSSATLTLQAGTISHTLTATNATTATNIICDDVTGFYSNDVVVVQSAAGVCTAATVWGTSQSTNLILTAQLGVAGSIGDQVNRMGTNTVGMAVDKIVLKMCNCTAVYGGNQLFAAGGGRPVRLVLTGTSACSIDDLSIQYK